MPRAGSVCKMNIWSRREASRANEKFAEAGNGVYLFKLERGLFILSLKANARRLHLHIL